MKTPNFNTVLDRAKAEILADIKSGLVPSNIEAFEELHNFVDANYYGGFCDEDYELSEGLHFEESIQTALDTWIKSDEFKTAAKTR